MENLILYGGDKIPCKAERQTIAKEVVEAVRDGRAGKLSTWIKCKAIINIAETILNDEEMYRLADEELSLHPNARSKDGVEVYGVKVAKAAVRKYDYKLDSVWADLQEKIDEAAGKLLAEQKERETMLKKIPAGKSILDENTGEVMAKSVCVKDGETIKVTLQ